MAEKVTKRQQAVLDCIEECIREKGYGPTVREVCQSLGLSSSTVHVHLKALEEKGFIRLTPLKSRSIALTHLLETPAATNVVAPSFSNIVSVPSWAMQRAGSPILAEENITDTLSLPTEIVGDAPSFVLSVRGESMIEAGINDGDYVVVKEQPVANNGDIVVAIIDDGATVKALLPGKRPHPPAAGELHDGPHHHHRLRHRRQGGRGLPPPVTSHAEPTKRPAARWKRRGVSI